MSERPHIALCVTCLVDQVLPEIGVATVNLLRRAGYRVDFPQAQLCCGQPFFNSGFQDEAARLARRTIEIFEPYPAIVLPSGSCTTMIRVEYPHLLADDPAWHARAEQLAQKTYELSEFLVKVAGWSLDQLGADPGIGDTGRGDTGRGDTAVTYHDSCHMCRLLHLQDEPRQALAAAGCTVHEMAESDRCCGFGGLFSVRMPEVANAMTAEKLRQAAATGTTVLVTADPGCLMQMRGLANESGVQVRHLAVVLDEQTRPQQEARRP